MKSFASFFKKITVKNSTDVQIGIFNNSHNNIYKNLFKIIKDITDGNIGYTDYLFYETQSTFLKSIPNIIKECYEVDIVIFDDTAWGDIIREHSQNKKLVKNIAKIQQFEQEHIKRYGNVVNRIFVYSLQNCIKNIT